jgi:hypothetical protein
MARVMAVALDVMDRPWVWGESDCCTAACDVFLRLYGTDPMRSVRGSYSTQVGAARLILSYGGMLRMAETLARREGLVRGTPRQGSLGVHKNSLVICVRPWVWLGKSATGMVTLQDAEVAYHVAT